MIRKPAVAGMFYPRDGEELKGLVRSMIDPTCPKEKAFCAVAPHAGLIYSGRVAGALYSSLDLPEKFVIMGPNHRYSQTRIAVMREGIWEMPMGEVKVDESLANSILSKSSAAKDDFIPHQQEHSLEVQLPFIQFFRPQISIVPICISAQSSYEDLEDLGKAIAESIRESEEEVLIVASTDMSHYVSEETAREKDFKAIDAILARDAGRLLKTVADENISMCGFQPTAVAILASHILGAEQAELIKYETSGVVSGDYSEVVGYAGVRIR